MNTRILVAYGTKSGSTADVAEAIGRALSGDEIEVEVRRAVDVSSVEGYAAVVLGAPRVSSVWQPDAIDFLARLRAELVTKPVAYFITSMTLTRVADARVGSIPVFQDPAHSRPPRRIGKLSFIEKETTPFAYLKPILKEAPEVVPVQVAFLAGKLDYSTLDVLHRAFFKFVLRIPPSDSRNWIAIRSWAQGLRSVFRLTTALASRRAQTTA
jgi:menaquinone-dependent protoporphyrinogen oxidase